jgi:hypothetical protein
MHFLSINLVSCITFIYNIYFSSCIVNRENSKNFCFIHYTYIQIFDGIQFYPINQILL